MDNLHPTVGKDTVSRYQTQKSNYRQRWSKTDRVIRRPTTKEMYDKGTQITEYYW